MHETVIILAGGKSERTGNTPKGLLLVDKKPWILAQCEAVKKVGCEVLVVLGYHAEKFEVVIGDKYPVVINPDPAKGQQSSIHTGLKEIKSGPVFILPVDVPCPSTSVWEALRRSLNAKTAAIPTFEGKGGHPVLLAPKAFSFEGRLDIFLHRIPVEEVVRVPVEDPTICENWNHSENYPS